MDNSKERIIQLETELRVHREYSEKRDRTWEVKIAEIQRTISEIKSGIDVHNRLLEQKFNDALKEFRMELKEYIHKDSFDEKAFVTVEKFDPIAKVVARHEDERRKVLYALIAIIFLAIWNLIKK